MLVLIPPPCGEGRPKARVGEPRLLAVITGLDPVIHVFLSLCVETKTWMAGS